MHAPEIQEEFKPPDTQPCGSRGCPPRWPPAPPGSGEALPPFGSGPHRYRPRKSEGGEAGSPYPSRIPWLAGPLEEGAVDLEILHAVLSAVVALQACDVEVGGSPMIDARLEGLAGDARKRLLARMSHLKAHLRGDPSVDDLYAFKAGVLAWAARPQEARPLDVAIGCAGEAACDPPHPEDGDRLPSTYQYTLQSGRPTVEIAFLKPAAFAAAVLDDFCATLAAPEGNSHPLAFAAGVRRKYAVFLLSAGTDGERRESAVVPEGVKLPSPDASLFGGAEGSFAAPFESFSQLVSMMDKVVATLGAVETWPEESSPEEPVVAEVLQRALRGLRTHLVEQLNALERRVSQPEMRGCLEADFRRFKTAMLLLLGWGVEREKLAPGSDSPICGIAEDAGDPANKPEVDDRYIYRMRSGVTFSQVFGVAPCVVARWAIADLRTEVLDDRNFTGPPEFERGIRQKFQAWWLAARGELLEPQKPTRETPDDPQLRRDTEETDGSGE